MHIHIQDYGITCLVPKKNHLDFLAILVCGNSSNILLKNSQILLNSFFMFLIMSQSPPINHRKQIFPLIEKSRMIFFF